MPSSATRGRASAQNTKIRRNFINIPKHQCSVRGPATGGGKRWKPWDRRIRRPPPLRLQCRAMPLFRVFRMKDSPRQQFRWAPHVSGAAIAKPKDFEPAGEIDALHEYDAWRMLRDAGTPLLVGDLLETES